MLRDINAKNCRAAEHPISLITANGSTEANEVADVKLPALPYPVQPYVLDQTPAVLSVGNQVCRASENCHCIRATEKDDGTQISCRQRLASQVQDFRNDFDNGTLILYASLACVGGSPWGNVNGLTVEGQERIQEQQRLFNKLFKSFAKLVDEVGDDKTLIAFELSRNCKYWKWPMVREFLIDHSMSTHNFDGCMFGVVGNDGQPIKKGWTIAGHFKELAKLEFFKCDSSHKHGQGRGKALNLAENYTFRLTDLLHECFRAAAVGQISETLRCPKLACLVKMADSRAAAEPASREAALQTGKEQSVIPHHIEGQETNDFVAGLQNDWTPASAIRFFANNDPVARRLSFSILPEEEHLNRRLQSRALAQITLAPL